MKRITLHNHIFIDTEERPIVPNLEFKKLCEEIDNGNYAAFDLALEKYSFIPFQISFIKELIKRTKNGRNTIQTNK